MVLAVLLLVVPLVELYLIIQVAQVIGGWETIALLLIESVVGAWLMKRQGLSVLGRIDAALRDHRLPHRELIDGFLILLAGALLLTPGFLTDVVGFLLLIPPTRAVVRALVIRRFRDRLGVGVAFLGGPGGAGGDEGGSTRRRRWVDSTVVDTTAHEPRPDQPERPRPDELGPGRY